MASPIDLSGLESLVKSLDSRLDSVGVKLAVATAAVVFGLLIEYEHDAREAFNALKECVRNRRLTEWIALERHIKSAVIGGIFITGGVAAELWYEHRTNVLEGNLQVANGGRFAYLRDRATAAEERSKILEKSTQQLKTEAQQSKERADTLETGLQTERQTTARFQAEAAKAQLALERQQTPRWILLERDKKEFISTLSRFKAQITILHCGVLPDLTGGPVKLFQELTMLLGPNGANWVVVGGFFPGCVRGEAGWDGGNGVYTNPSASEEVKAAAKSLTDELNRLGVYSRWIPGPNGFGPPSESLKDPNVIVLLVAHAPDR